ncbi:hypothetical protein KBB25_00010 [Candidatus Gracilibacteria bacterium]|nr:hypothetical protein [Candidatus Gracilibacteria bacterium]
MPAINHLSDYSRSDLESTLKILKSYRLSLLQIGKHAKLVDPKNLPALQVRVEYAPSLEESVVKEYAYKCLLEAFPGLEHPSDLSCKENPQISGGIRVFAGDDLVDISLEKFLTLLKPSV